MTTRRVSRPQLRRQFLGRSALVSLSPWIPAILPRSLNAAQVARDERILVVIQLDGGNDGLNTVIPFADKDYARCRRQLRIPEQDVLKLSDSIGLHPAMRPAAELFEQGRLTIVQAVGYPNPNRSHFRSMAIWQHGWLEKHRHDSIGWLGRAADAGWSRQPLSPEETGAPDSIYVGEGSVPVTLRGRRANPVSFLLEDDLILSRGLAPSPAGLGGSELSAYVTRTLDRSYAAARRFSESEAGHQGDGATYPSTALAEKLRLAARLIKHDGGTRVYYVSQPGYDTHAGQANPHRRLLGEFAGALRAFLDDLREAGLEERVVVLGFSEFGRRVRENESGGTDHGAAAPVFLAGSRLHGGLLGDHPSLSDLDADDLKMSIDFRSLYATLLDEWLSVPSETVLGGTFDKLPLFTS